MKWWAASVPFGLAFVAAIGNALVTYAQKKATPFDHPFYFGAFSLLLASLGLFGIATFFSSGKIIPHAVENFVWFAVAAAGLILLNIFLYVLYRHYGAAYYTLYAILAMVTTSIGLAVLVFKESMNVYFWLSFLFAALTVVCFIKGKSGG